MHIFTDGFTSVSLSNGNLRVKLAQNGPDNEPVEVATLIVPATHQRQASAKPCPMLYNSSGEQIKSKQSRDGD